MKYRRDRLVEGSQQMGAHGKGRALDDASWEEGEGRDLTESSSWINKHFSVKKDSILRCSYLMMQKLLYPRLMMPLLR